MSRRDVMPPGFTEFIKGLARETRDAIDRALVRRDARLDALARRLDALEAKPHVVFRGLHDESKAYNVGGRRARAGCGFRRCPTTAPCRAAPRPAGRWRSNARRPSGTRWTND